MAADSKVGGFMTLRFVTQAAKPEVPDAPVSLGSHAGAGLLKINVWLLDFYDRNVANRTDT
jgi:hypothetical protein